MPRLVHDNGRRKDRVPGAGAKRPSALATEKTPPSARRAEQRKGGGVDLISPVGSRARSEPVGVHETAVRPIDSYLLVACLFGLVVLLTAWLPMLIKELPLSLPIFCVGFGFIVFSVPGAGTPPSPLDHPSVTEHFCEIVVIIALMGAGLKIDRPLGWRSWILTWRLLGFVMPLSIAGIALLAWAGLGAPLATALLLGALLAPTDPVLAADVQVGPPGSGVEDEVRFGLTSEAGLNDGLAFPFTHAAIAFAIAGTGTVGDWALKWFSIAVLWKIVVGVACGWLVGRVLGYCLFHLPNRAKLSRTGDGFVALGITFLSYGLTELAHGYGFLAVFVTALALRHAERHHRYHEKLHEFSEQIERLLMMLLLFTFGGAIAGGLLADLTWSAVLFALACLLVVRPLAGLIGLVGCGRPWAERLIIAFFGIRGVGSFYYLAYALNHADFADPSALWAVVGFIVLGSVVAHGMTVTPVMRAFDRRRPAASRLELDNSFPVERETP